MKHLHSSLDDIKKLNLFRNLNYLKNAQDKYVTINNKKVLLMASNNYLGLCNDIRLKNACKKAIDDYGVGSGGSRLTTGSYEIHKLLEKKLAFFKRTESALIFNNGYMANIGVLSSITNENWTIFSDKLNHASIIDGCKLSKATTIVYNHCDMNDLEYKLNICKCNNKLIVTDGVFSMDGIIAPIDKIYKLSKQYNALTMVDDAHGTGVLGSKGRGTLEYFNLENKIDIQVGTLSKALGSEGGFVAGSTVLINFLINKSRSFIYSTAISPINIAASLTALDIISTENHRRKTLLNNSLWFQYKLKELGFKIISTNTPIISLIIGDSKLTVKFSNALFEEGIFISPIRPPTVPIGSSRLRISLMATHTRKELEFVLKKLKKIGTNLNIV